jgi:hypothetical protein
LDTLNDNERPLICRTDSTPAGSLGSLLKRFPSYRTQNSVWRTASLPSLGIASAVAIPNYTPPKPTRFTVDTGSDSPTRMKFRGPYFGFGPLTSQPEEDRFNSPSGSTLSSPTSPRQSANYISQSSERTSVDQGYISEPPKPIPSPSITRPRSPAASPKRPGSSSSSSSGVFDNSDGQNKGNLRDQLQKRVYRARRLIPEDIVLRIFGDPTECVEVDEILRLERSAAHND